MQRGTELIPWAEIEEARRALAIRRGEDPDATEAQTDPDPTA